MSVQLNDEEVQNPLVAIGGMIGKVIVIGLVAFLLWAYSTTFLDQVGIFF